MPESAALSARVRCSLCPSPLLSLPESAALSAGYTNLLASWDFWLIARSTTMKFNAFNWVVIQIFKLIAKLVKLCPIF